MRYSQALCDQLRVRAEAGAVNHNVPHYLTFGLPTELAG